MRDSSKTEERKIKEVKKSRNNQHHEEKAGGKRHEEWRAEGGEEERWNMKNKDSASKVVEECLQAAWAWVSCPIRCLIKYQLLIYSFSCSLCVCVCVCFIVDSISQQVTAIIKMQMVDSSGVNVPLSVPLWTLCEDNTDPSSWALRNDAVYSL